jgi:hypothetical protein
MSTSYSTPELNRSRPFMRRLVIVSALLITLATVGFLLIQANSTSNRQSGDSTTFNHTIPAQVDATVIDAEILGEPYHFDHSVVNKQNLPDESNPAPMAIAAYN